MKEIGGFFELELNNGVEYYDDLIKLSSGRNALLYLIQAKRIEKVYIPYYCCNAFIEPIKQMDISFEFYNIDEDFLPILNKRISDSDNEYLIYINYFGLNKKKCIKLSNKYNNLIIDNTQAFFSNPIKNVDTFYSPRKFFGVPDGGYLKTNIKLNKDFSRSYSYDKCEHLLKRADVNANSSYDLFKENELKLNLEPIKRMSKLTQKLLSNIKYEEVRTKRVKNFMYLNSAFSNINKLSFDKDRINGPMTYPLLLENNNIKEELINKKIYIPTYWKEVMNRTKKDDFGNYLTRKMLPLPIDQRYNLEDMDKIINEIFNLL